VKTVWYVKAERDLQRAVTFIQADNPAAARAVDQRLRGAVGHLDRFPDAGRPGRTAGTREIVIPEYPYIIRYRVKDDQVQVLRIFHASRRWPE
jgi:addiction module RelE/StbE family toxin